MTTPRRAKPVAVVEPPAAARPVAEWTLRILATLVGTAIASATALLAAFLVPLRIGSTYLPLSWVIVVVGIYAALWVARYGAGSALATVLPIVAWGGTLLPLSKLTKEGDLVIEGTWVGYGTLLLGLTALVVTMYFLVVKPSGKVAQRPLGRR